MEYREEGREALRSLPGRMLPGGTGPLVSSFGRDLPGIDRSLARRRLSACPEVDCLRHRLPVGIIAAAEQRAIEIGVGADRVLIASGAVSEDFYLSALSTTLGITFEPLALLPREACPLENERLIEAVAAGILPVRTGRRIAYVVAPRGLAVRRLLTFFAQYPDMRGQIRLTSAAHLKQFVSRHGSGEIGDKAAEGLRKARPELSAAGGKVSPLAMVIAGLILATVLAVAPVIVASVAGFVFAAIFVAWIALRLVCAWSFYPRDIEPVRFSADHLPVYTIIVALYREAAAVEGLIEALRALDYPAEKLDIKLVIEPDDFDTRNALAAQKLGPSFDIVVAPDIGPRTKPKALNIALAYARGTFTAVYDAEDRPEPDQLKRALDAFLDGGERVGCVQACLTIDNTHDSWLTAFFTAEYAGLFDVFLPGLAERRLPLPLGGSSNHFRTAVLREVGAWDAYNVTEDADLGMRLSRFGYHTRIIASTTYEEAPAKLVPWLRQRTRWFKGWMQTWLIHMRAPLTLMHELGPAGFIGFQLAIGGTILASLIHPLFVAALLYSIGFESLLWPGDGILGAVLTILYSATFIAGYFTTVLLGFVGLSRRGLLSSAWVLALVPLHWLLLSIAAWRALYQLVHDPYRWEKTEHGLARTSRLAKQF